MENILAFFFILAITSVGPAAVSGQTSEPACIDCHSSVSNSLVKHEAMDIGCDLCHKETAEIHPESNVKGFTLTEEMPALCFMCHDQPTKKNLHAVSTECMMCHSPHSGDIKGLLIQKMPDLCYNCHDMQTSIEDAPVVHKVINDKKGCANCHSPHESDQSKLLLSSEKELCLSCHSKEIKTDEGIITNIGELLKSGNYVHGIIEGDGCIVCHNPHYSNNNSLLNAVFQEDQYVRAEIGNFELCFMCHDSELMTVETTTSATNFRNGEKNMHFLHINGEKGRNCNVCHNVHGSVFEHLIADKVLFGTWEMPIQYIVQHDGGSCKTGCHGEKKYNR